MSSAANMYCRQLLHLRVHRLPPSRAKVRHGPYDHRTRQSHQSKNRKHPSVPYPVNDWRRDHTPDAREDVAHEVVDGDTRGRLFRHELGQHRRCDAEDEHGSEAEEEVGNHLDIIW